jgi:hypothetical protein
VIGASKTAGPSDDRVKNDSRRGVAGGWRWRGSSPRSPSHPISSRRDGHDLDRDGAQELVYGDAHGAVHAVDTDGDPLPGWPAETNRLELGLSHTPPRRAGALPEARDPIMTAPAIGDINRDAGLEIVAVSTSGRLYVALQQHHLYRSRAATAPGARTRRATPNRAELAA